MKLSHPTYPFFITQGFGDNAEFYAKHVPGLKGHNGLDLMARHGDLVYAAHDGIAYPGVDDREGYGVVIRTHEPIDGVYWKTIYWHLIPDGRVSGPVKRGQVIGYADNTGLSLGDHLHFGLKPQALNEENGTWINTEQSNGFFGAVDPAPYLQNGFIFRNDMKLGDTSVDVFYLQQRLGVKTTWYYGPLTQKAVFQFQLKNVKMSWWEANVLRGRTVGPKTREALNKLSTF